jgi:hypothetical protein
MKLVYVRLTADCFPRKQEGKVKWVTPITIRLDGGRAVASATLGGRYDEQAALAEFRKSPGRFLSAAPFGSYETGLFANGAFKPFEVHSFDVPLSAAA